jgi:hypothetical protein
MQYLVLGVTTVVVDIIVMIGYATLATRIAGVAEDPTPNATAEPHLWLAVHPGRRAAGHGPKSLMQKGRTSLFDPLVHCPKING